MNFLDTLSNLAADFPKKIIATALGLLASEVLQLHLILIFMFGILEFCDCFTRWIALSHECILASNPEAQPTICDCIKGIITAHKTYKDKAANIRYIDSSKMRSQWFNKMVIYTIIIIVAGFGDFMMKLTHRPEILVSIVVMYISVTEFISCLENLNEAGVAFAEELLLIVKDKTNGILGVRESRKEGEQPVQNNSANGRENH